MDMDKLNPDALADSGDSELDAREGVQSVDEYMIKWYVIETEELPEESADPFASWIYANWTEWNEEGKNTNGDVIAGALDFWCGGRTLPATAN